MTTLDVESVRRSYRAAFLRYLPRRDEAALMTGYEIGRDALRAGVSVVAISTIHHEMLGEVLATPGDPEISHTLTSAGQFLAEVLAPFDLAGGAVIGLTTPEDASGPS